MKRSRRLEPVDGHMRQFKVLRRNPQIEGDPTFAVACSGSGTNAELAALFYSEIDAQDYARWRNRTPIIQRKPK